MHGSVPSHRTRPIFDDGPGTSASWRPRAFHVYRRQLQRHLPLAALTTGVLTFLMILYLLFFARHTEENPPPLTPPPPYDDGPGRPEFYPWDTTSLFHPVRMYAKGKTADDLCPSFPHHLLQQSIQPVLKIGHADVGKPPLEAQLASASACLEDLLIFSDLDEHDFPGNRSAYDVLADLPAAYARHADFGNYTYMRQLRDAGTLDVDDAATAAIRGWAIDKYKFLPMVERAWAMRPHRDWYVFYETDTYVSWDNTFRFLANLDPDAPLYIGSPSPGRTVPDTDHVTWFANGGPGFVLSRGAMRRFLARKVGEQGDFLEAPQSHRWPDLLDIDCCGDSVLGWALWTAGVPLVGFWPLFNPDPLHAVGFDEDHWCQPVLTLHKTKPEDMMELWRWEHINRQQHKPLLYRDLYQFYHPGQIETRADWDNSDPKAWEAPETVDSFEACGVACGQNPECFQWNWHGGKCRLIRSIRHGFPRAADRPDENGQGGGAYMSGWASERIAAWRSARTCDVVGWVRPSITRIF
ncbi:hypothetical protein SODALDRAFT_331731 [Sodiomyces alkalinus F11]|uniref:N-acetylgalactosaminide beta-1,3-galactosyltransferase n=1 Tax=Sodiomyces alkalinus (strain CBS 110278 / VKM F-3762 / F11) TaxID=1314773 RepID=A0A3N2PYX4_SODAK|nr:hypothetical protein SODALDRAFT_331731 [Sodiomyces alkalinus F11]ROT39626.1 hypothetical protein SODALDRAFT_331731 [Sodiomyces alkalinus F11]